ncbi:MAG TPA: hypothetical protein VK171_03075 [Fimbriimonas sp.]|nr:hypothetical protein [Fimbriimonas sp.]
MDSTLLAFVCCASLSPGMIPFLNAIKVPSALCYHFPHTFVVVAAIWMLVQRAACIRAMNIESIK